MLGLNDSLNNGLVDGISNATSGSNQIGFVSDHNDETRASSDQTLDILINSHDGSAGMELGGEQELSTGILAMGASGSRPSEIKTCKDVDLKIIFGKHKQHMDLSDSDGSFGGSKKQRASKSDSTQLLFPDPDPHLLLSGFPNLGNPPSTPSTHPFSAPSVSYSGLYCSSAAFSPLSTTYNICADSNPSECDSSLFFGSLSSHAAVAVSVQPRQHP